MTARPERSDFGIAKRCRARASAASRYRATPPSLDQALVLKLLAVEAVPRPRHGLDPLLLHGRRAVDADAVRAGVEARERLVDQDERLPVVLGEGIREFLRVRGGGAIGHVLRRLVDGLVGDLAVLDEVLEELVSLLEEPFPDLVP